MNTQTDKNIIVDKAYQNMLGGLDPQVAAKLAEKWSEDQNLFRDFVKEKTGGKEACEWGKSSCRKCYGRGYTGISHTAWTKRDPKDPKPLEGGTKVVCRCAEKNYRKELQALRTEFNTLREETNVSDEQAQETPNRPENTEEALESNAATDS